MDELDLPDNFSKAGRMLWLPSTHTQIDVVMLHMLTKSGILEGLDFSNLSLPDDAQASPEGSSKEYPG